jgi:mannosyltransferase OCH1-like enzyme
MSENIENVYKIPNIIHQTFINKILPAEIVSIIKHNKKVCPSCKFIFYDDNDCDNFIKNNFVERTYCAYKNINPVYGAMKADFFRYCVLYKLGGVYLDIKSIIYYPIFKLLKPDDICILDLPRNYLEKWRKNSPTYEQWLLIFAPGHPYLLEMINQMTHYIEIKYEPKIYNYGVLNSKQQILHVTGPDAFTKVINNYNEKNGILHRLIDYNKYFDRSPIGEKYKDIYKIHNKKHYSEYNQPLYK